MSKKKHPMQPVILADDNVVRFKPNKIVIALLDHGRETGLDMNKLAMMDFSQEDREQFAQLIGYSVSGYSDLSYVSDKTYNKVIESKSYSKAVERFRKNVK